ncbi:MAG: 3-dehydroquinate synthase II [Candidatus Bathyarchaeota archaeon]
MRELWVEIPKSLPTKTKKILLKKLATISATAIIDRETSKIARSLGVRVASSIRGSEVQMLEKLTKDEIKRLKKTGKLLCVRLTVKRKADEEKVSEAARYGIDYLIVNCPNWKIIPLENLIAKVHGRSKLLAEVSSPQEAKLALETLELGADGVVLKTAIPSDILVSRAILDSVKTRKEEVEGGLKIDLALAKITAVKQLGPGARACIDTCDLMTHGEGILSGCQSSGLFLVQAEVYENPHVEARPFRVNVGAISLYALAPGNKTHYLSELKVGDEVLITDRNGNQRTSIIGRVKIEKRPLMLVEAVICGKHIKTIVQNAETIRLVTKKGSISVADLKPGQEVLTHFQTGGRHFGMLVKEETVIER